MTVRTLALVLRDMESPQKVLDIGILYLNIYCFKDSMVADLRTQWRDKRVKKGHYSLSG